MSAQKPVSLQRLLAGFALAALAYGAHRMGWIELGKTTVEVERTDEPDREHTLERGPEPEAPTANAPSKPAPNGDAFAGKPRPAPKTGAPKSNESAPGDGGAQTIQALFRAQRSDVQVEGFGTVAKVLRDDVEGDRHQKFLLELSNGLTLLIAHNIDLAPRVPLEQGDRVSFHGEYEWNEQGGVLHWTHHDPAGRHADGWLELDGKRYR